MRPATKRSARANDVDIDRASGFALAPRKVALVAAHDSALAGYAPFLSEIAAAAEASECDTIVYALALPAMALARPARLFGRTRAVKTVFLEVTRADSETAVEVWRKGAPAPHRFRQRLVTSQDSVECKRALMSGLPARTFGSTTFLVCGEVNIISTRRGSTATIDRFGFMDRLADQRLILNPSHSYIRRHEIKEKRRRCSGKGRIVLSVWNPGHHDREPAVPWQAFVDGREVTEHIESVSFAETTIRMGVFDLRGV